jgi:membrane-associated phospholipid phosphatase
MVYNLLDNIGVFAPIILIVISVFLLQNKIQYLKIYICGIVLNNILNFILKNIIKEPRPSQSSRVLEIAVANKQIVDYDKFGMPSGHAQSCGYELIFITLVLNNSFITGLYLVITFLSMFQRYKFNNHTILQLIVGLLIGMGFGYLSYNIANKWIKGNLKIKLDDYAPK